MSQTEFHPMKVAAIVYDDGVAIDSLMSAFARELRTAGVDARGLLQLPPDGEGCGPGAPMRLQIVETGNIIPICQDLGPGSKSCRLDLAGIAEAAARLRASASRPSDLLFVSKFGKQEAHGAGFRDELAFAAGAGRTILTAVKRGQVHNWLDFTGGVGTLLEARLSVLRDWWREVRPARAA